MRRIKETIVELWDMYTSGLKYVAPIVAIIWFFGGWDAPNWAFNAWTGTCIMLIIFYPIFAGIWIALLYLVTLPISLIMWISETVERIRA